MLSFYNAIANNGKYVAPIFVKEIRRFGNTIEKFEARVINEQICSEETLKKMQEMLESVVKEGTGRRIIYNPLYRIAGKTGTAQVADGNRGYKANRQYQASFCGYFPADNPKYSLIVVINDPKNGYYGASVAGPVFREIADKVYSSDLDINQNTPIRFVGNTDMPKSKAGYRQATQMVYQKLGIKALYAAANTEYVTTIDTNNGIAMEEIKAETGTVPSTIGMGMRDALYLLGNSGYKVVAKGSGTVVKQSVLGGSKIPQGANIVIELQ